MKTIISIACFLLLVGSGSLSEAKAKRHVLYAAAPVAVAAAPVAVAAAAPVSVVHSHPTTVVKTEQTHDGLQSTYSYSTEYKTNPVVHAHVASAPAVATVHHTVPVSAYNYGYRTYGYYPYASHYYSPYSYVLGK